LSTVAAADAAGLEAAVGALSSGGVIAVPTDTVYGLAVIPTLPGATDLLYAAKGRPRSVPIAVLVADAEQAWGLAAAPVPRVALRLAERHWPGALTLVVRRAEGWSADLGDDGATVGVRCPDHEWIRSLCQRVGPLATTSANVHGGPTPPDAPGVAELLGASVALVVDGGRREGDPSTVLDCTVEPPQVLRAGRVPASALDL
jgi:tRNA threonylcarbamoyl adenosine modification protein (Sua5/YciO/YrdC/YwlC family)